MPPLPLAAVLVLILVAILIAVLVFILGVVLILVAILVLVLVIHSLFLQICNKRSFRSISLPNLSSFILCSKYKACYQSGKNRSGNAAGSGFQSTGEDP